MADGEESGTLDAWNLMYHYSNHSHCCDVVVVDGVHGDCDLCSDLYGDHHGNLYGDHHGNLYNDHYGDDVVSVPFLDLSDAVCQHRRSRLFHVLSPRNGDDPRTLYLNVFFFLDQSHVQNWRSYEYYQSLPHDKRSCEHYQSLHCLNGGKIYGDQ